LPKTHATMNQPAKRTSAGWSGSWSGSTIEDEGRVMLHFARGEASFEK
jgi:hypothetical protein